MRLSDRDFGRRPSACRSKTESLRSTGRSDTDLPEAVFKLRKRLHMKAKQELRSR